MSGLFAGTSLERPVTCEKCGKTHALCACPRHRQTGRVLEPREQPVRVRREQRRGKFVTVIAGLSPRSARTDDLPALLKHFRTTLASGGTVADDGTPKAEPIIELQGDHRDRVVAHMVSLGYPAKSAGG